MGMGALVQLIAKGQQSPITSALGGFQQGAGLLPGIKMAQLAPALRQAQTQLALAKAQMPFGGQALTGPAGMAMSELKFQGKYGSDADKMQTLQYYKQFQMRSQNIRDFGNMTKDERANLYAKFRGAGFSQDEAAKYLSNGYTLAGAITARKTGQDPLSLSHSAENYNNSKLAVDKQEIQHNARPINPNEIKLKYPLSAEAETAQQKAVAASAGMDYLSKAIIQGLNYGGIMSTVTRPWFWDSRSNDPEKQQKAVNYYAAHSLKPELALYRMRIQQGTASARAMKQLTPTILGDIKPKLELLPPNIQKRIQNRVREVLEESTRQSSLKALGKDPTMAEAPDSSQNISSTAPATTPQAQQTATGKIRVRSPDGKVGSIPKEDLQEAIKQGFKRI